MKKIEQPDGNQINELELEIKKAKSIIEIYKREKLVILRELVKIKHENEELRKESVDVTTSTTKSLTNVKQSYFLHLSKIKPLMVSAILEYEGRASSGICSQPSNLSLMINELSELYKCLLLHDNQPEITFQIFKKLFSFMVANLLNIIMLRKDLCHWIKVKMRF